MILLLILAIGLIVAIPFIVAAVRENNYEVTSVNDYGPVLLKSMDAVRFTTKAPGPDDGVSYKLQSV